ncbi:MAG: alpha/beta hydrolase [Candidatus Nanopelagicales bacterium]
MASITASSILPARRYPVELLTEDGVRLVGEWALPAQEDPRAVIVWCHPLPTHGGSQDSHLIRKSSWRLPALTGIAVLRFNFRGTSADQGASEGEFQAGEGERFDLLAALDEVVRAGMPDPWLVGWSFGTDVILRWGNTDPVTGAVLLSPPGRWSSQREVDRWAGSGRPLRVLVPELDEFAGEQAVRARFAQVPEADVVMVPGARHLWVGEKYTWIALNGIVSAVLPEATPLPQEWTGEMAFGE